MSSRFIRIRRWNKETNEYDVYYPQTSADNIVREDNLGILENDLRRYDRHLKNPHLHLTHVGSTGTNKRLAVQLNGIPLIDGMPLLIKLHTNLEYDPTLSYNGGEGKHIIGSNGEPIPGGQIAGSLILVAWNEAMDSWIMLSADEYRDLIRVMLPVVHDYNITIQNDECSTFAVPNFDHTRMQVEINYGQTILRRGIDYSFSATDVDTVILHNFALSEGDVLFFHVTEYDEVTVTNDVRYDIEIRDYNVEIEEDNTNTVRVPSEAIGSNHIELNYGQTILRAGIDYELSDDNYVHLLNFSLSAGDILCFHVSRMVERKASRGPSNWGASGNYRYAIKVLHEEFTAEEDNVYVVPVPNYDRRSDDLTVVKDNRVLINGVDYTVDELNQVVLQYEKLNTGNSLYFTIQKGSMVDVPNFYTAEAVGDSPKDLLVNFTYDTLTDYFTLLVQLKYRLETAPTLKCIDGPAEPIVDCYGKPVLGGYAAGAYLWLVYNAKQRRWYSLSHGQLDLSDIESVWPIFSSDEGDANFFGNEPLDYTEGDDPSGVGELVIPHNLGVKPNNIYINPIEPPGFDDEGNPRSIGDIWYTADEHNLYVGNSGNATSQFRWRVSRDT